MTSNINIVFSSAKDFDVNIDSIESLSPRGLELAWKVVQKNFAVMKGQVGTARRKSEVAEAERKADEQAEADQKALLFDEEIAKHTTEALKAADERFESAPEEAKKALLEATKVNEANLAKRAVLSEVEARVQSIRAANAEVSPEDAADQAMDDMAGSGNEGDRLDAQIEEVSLELDELLEDAETSSDEDKTED